MSLGGRAVLAPLSKTVYRLVRRNSPRTSVHPDARSRAPLRHWLFLQHLGNGLAVRRHGRPLRLFLRLLDFDQRQPRDPETGDE